MPRNNSANRFRLIVAALCLAMLEAGALNPARAWISPAFRRAAREDVWSVTPDPDFQIASSFDWSVPVDLERGKVYRVRVVARDVAGNTASDSSDANFKIK